MSPDPRPPSGPSPTGGSCWGEGVWIRIQGFRASLMRYHLQWVAGMGVQLLLHSHPPRHPSGVLGSHLRVEASGESESPSRLSSRYEDGPQVTPPFLPPSPQEGLEELMVARKRNGLHCSSQVKILACHPDLYVARIGENVERPDFHGLLVKMGPTFDMRGHAPGDVTMMTSA